MQDPRPANPCKHMRGDHQDEALWCTPYVCAGLWPQIRISARDFWGSNASPLALVT